MDRVPGFKKEANGEVPKNCILLFCQQGPLKMAAKKDKSAKFTRLQSECFRLV